MPQDLNDLFYFALVVDHSGFAPAGRALGIPKSKLSRRIALLEARLGVRLIQRSTRSFLITEIGQSYYNHCKAMLIEANAAQEAIDMNRSEPQGIVRLSCPVALLQSQVAPILARFLVDNPRVSLQVEATNRRVDVIAEGFDVAIRVRPPPLDDSDLVMKVLGERTWCLAASPSLLEHHAAPLTPADLHGMPSIDLGPPQTSYFWRLEGAAGEQATVHHTPRMVTGDMPTLLQAAIAGVGVVSMPTMMMSKELADGRLVKLIPYWTLKRGVMHVIYPSRRLLRPAVRQIIDYLGAGFAKMDSQ